MSLSNNHCMLADRMYYLPIRPIVCNKHVYCVDCFAIFYKWKAPHKKQASDTVCTFYTLKRQWHLPCFVCMHYCVKRPKPSTQKQGKWHLSCFCVDDFGALNAIIHALIHAFVSLMCKSNTLSLAFFLCGAFQMFS